MFGTDKIHEQIKQRCSKKDGVNEAPLMFIGKRRRAVAFSLRLDLAVHQQKKHEWVKNGIESTMSPKISSFEEGINSSSPADSCRIV
jgi:hypothetical protein